jgi:voltage-dependent potassium channel beta subunit
MIYNRLGGSGLKVSALSLGSWVTYGRHVDNKVAKACVHAALDHAVNFIDSAEAYAGGQAEVVLGGIIRDLRREDLVLSSKVFWGGEGPNDMGLNRKHVYEACHGALKRLGVDYLDLYFCHRPDPDTPIVETIETMDLLVRQGKVLYWGTSEWSAEQIEKAFVICEDRNLIRPTMEQPQYHMFHRKRVESELAHLCRNRGLGMTIWSPLASGLLTGKYNDGIPENSRIAQPGLEWLADEFTPDKFAKVRELQGVANDLGCSMAQLALAWTLKCPNVSTTITGASRPEQVHENMEALRVVDSLDEEVMSRIELILD